MSNFELIYQYLKDLSKESVELFEQAVEHDLFGKRKNERHAARGADALFVPGSRSDNARLAKTGGREADQGFSCDHGGFSGAFSADERNVGRRF